VRGASRGERGRDEARDRRREVRSTFHRHSLGRRPRHLEEPRGVAIRLQAPGAEPSWRGRCRSCRLLPRSRAWNRSRAPVSRGCRRWLYATEAAGAGSPARKCAYGNAALPAAGWQGRKRLQRSARARRRRQPPRREPAGASPGRARDASGAASARRAAPRPTVAPAAAAAARPAVCGRCRGAHCRQRRLTQAARYIAGQPRRARPTSRTRPRPEATNTVP
jgi:hypothetical protein